MLKHQCTCGNTNIHPEHAGRIQSIWSRLQETGLLGKCEVRPPPQLFSPPISDLRVGVSFVWGFFFGGGGFREGCLILVSPSPAYPGQEGDAGGDPDGALGASHAALRHQPPQPPETRQQKAPGDAVTKARGGVPVPSRPGPADRRVPRVPLPAPQVDSDTVWNEMHSSSAVRMAVGCLVELAFKVA
ncbi:HDAC5 deacetylase, partial [Baryphthengus martii]|nr:HDAC5 deacetylase [Baryphthengus martii]